MRDLIELLGRAARQGGITLEPPEEVDAPAGLRELAAFASGCCPVQKGHEGLRWVGPMESEYLENCADAACMNIGHDECGNAWVLLFDSQGQAGQVLFACHDPAVLLAASDSLLQFLREWIEDPARLERGSDQMSKETRSRGVTREQGLTSSDPLVREFAASLDNQRWMIHDLRTTGRWFERDPLDTLRKHPDESVFAQIVLEEPPKRPWWKRWGSKP